MDCVFRRRTNLIHTPIVSDYLLWYKSPSIRFGPDETSSFPSKSLPNSDDMFLELIEYLLSEDANDSVALRKYLLLRAISSAEDWKNYHSIITRERPLSIVEHRCINGITGTIMEPRMMQSDFVPGMLVSDIDPKLEPMLLAIGNDNHELMNAKMTTIHQFDLGETLDPLYGIAGEDGLMWLTCFISDGFLIVTDMVADYPTKKRRLVLEDLMFKTLPVNSKVILSDSYFVSSMDQARTYVKDHQKSVILIPDSEKYVSPVLLSV